MKRFLLLCLTGITLSTLSFLSAAHASPGLRDIPQTGGNNSEVSPLDSLGAHANSVAAHGDSTEIFGNAAYESFYEYFSRDTYMDPEHTTASWRSRRLTLPSAAPAVRSQLSLPEAPTHVTVSGSFAYVTVATGFLVYDISDPDNVLPTGSYLMEGAGGPSAKASDIVVTGDAAYVCAGAAGLQVVDVSDPAAPAHVTTILPETPGDVRAAVTDGDFLYLVHTGVGMIVLDLSVPLAPAPVAELRRTGMVDIDLYNGIVALVSINNLMIASVLSPANPVFLDEYYLYDIRRLVIHDGMVYVTALRSLVGYDVGVPNDITRTSSIGLCYWGGVEYDERIGGLLYVGDGGCGINLVDVTNPDHIYVHTSVDLGTVVGQLALTDDHVFVVGTSPSRLVVLDRLTERHTITTATAQSTSIFQHHRLITDVRIEAEQEGQIAWEVSADGGVNWQSVVPGDIWVRVNVPGGDLRWRAVLAVEDDDVPVCTGLRVMWRLEPPPDRPGGVITVRLDGSGHATSLHEAREIVRDGDTLLLGDGVFSGPENRRLSFSESITIRSENGPEHTIIEGNNADWIFKFQGGDYDFPAIRIEGVQFRSAGPRYGDKGTVTSDRCYLNVDNCIFRGGTSNAFFSTLTFLNIRRSQFIDYDYAIAAWFNVDVSDCLFQGLDIAVWISRGGASIRNNTFFDNGAAIICLDGAGATIEDNTIANNGTAIWVDWSSANIRNNVIDSNQTGIRLEESHALPVSGNLIVRNTQAAMTIEGSEAQIEGNTFADNEVRRDALIEIRDFSDVTVRRNLIAFNAGGPPIGSFINTRATVSENNFYQTWDDPLAGTIDGGGNMFVDPMFCDRGSGLYTVALNSPCLEDNNGLGARIGARGVGCGTRNDVTAETPIRPGLISVAPNPFNPTTRIRYGLVEPGDVRLTIYDVAGRVVARLMDNEQDAGERDIEWNAGAVSSGVYFARLVTPEGAFTHKLVVVK